MKLLRERKAAGAPRDYIFARVRCRRAALDATGRSAWRGASRPHKLWRAEYLWLYGQLEEGLRRQLLPLFEYFELRTLVVALRYLAVGERAAVQEQLRASLLQQPLLRQLQDADKTITAIAGLERLLTADYPYVAGLAENYLRQGPGGVEQQLLGGCLQQGAACRSAAVREVLCYLLDLRNLLALYKHLRWQVPVAPPWLAGGTLDLAVCEKIWGSGDHAALSEVMRRRAGLKGEPEQVGVEEFMLSGLTKRLRQLGRDPLHIGVLLDYLWRCQLTARQQGLELADSDLSGLENAAEVAG